MSSLVDSTPQFIEAVYQKMDTNIALVKKRLGRPLTYGEKILYGHLDNAMEADLVAGVSYVKTCPDRVALQDATAQMAILQFMLAGKDEAAVPVTVHCDHQSGKPILLKHYLMDNSSAWQPAAEPITLGGRGKEIIHFTIFRSR